MFICDYHFYMDAHFSDKSGSLTSGDAGSREVTTWNVLISIFYLPAPLFPPSKGLQLLPLPCPACTLTYTPFPPFHLCPNNTLCYFVCVVGIWIRDQEVSDLKSQEIYLNFIVTVMMATTKVWQVASSDPLLWHKHYCYSNFQMRLRDLEKDAVIHWRLVTPRSTFAS